MINGMSVPALLGLKGMKKVNKKEYYKTDGTYRDLSKDDLMAIYMQHPIFGGYSHMFFNLEDKPLNAVSYGSLLTFCESQKSTDNLQSAVEGFNYLVKQVESKNAWLIDRMYPEEEIRKNPAKAHLTGMFYQGDGIKPLAVVVPGGGFICNCTAYEGYPVAMRLHKLGYCVLVISYPIGKQLGENEQEKQGQAAVKELVQTVKYLVEHESELSIDMNNYAIFGFSAGGLMTTAYSFANYPDSCHVHRLPRPNVIFPMYGLDWNIKAQAEDKGLRVFTIAGKNDEYGFGNVEDKVPQLIEAMGEENVSVRVLDGLGHGFGLGTKTIVPNWFDQAIEFWEKRG
ncbi:MAG TPA: alpha/beta hydrolase [Clostridia bacterium]|nr:alpha/beta hydrolase [Clostridia bacterium]